MPYNAVRVVAATNSPLYFGRLFADGDAQVASSAIGTRTPQAMFSIGSRLLTLDGGVINALLSAMLGSSVKLTVMDYRALADANIDLFDFMDALASEIDAKAGTYHEVANAEITAGDMFNAMAAVAHDNGMSDANLALKSLAMALGSSVKIPAGSLIDMGEAANAEIGTANAYGIDSTVNVLQMVSAFAAAADGDHQVKADLGATIPGLSSTTLTVVIGEPPQNSSWITFGEEGAIVRTAQLRLKLETKIGGTGPLSATSVNVPIYVDTAYGEATLSNIECAADPANAKVTVSARPGILNAYLGNVSNFTDFDAVPKVSNADLVSLPLIKVTGSAHADMGNVKADDLVFTGSEIGSGDYKTVTTKNYLESITGSLIGNTKLNVQVGLINLGLEDELTTVTKDLLASATKPIDSILYTTLSALGVRLGEADVWVNGVRCQHAVVVQ
jgi:uncharacterized membrane protein